MVDRGIFKKDFEPIVQPGEYIEVWPTPKSPTKKYYKVEMVLPLPLLEVDVCDSEHLDGNVTTSESNEVEIDDIYLNDGEIAHLRMIPRDDFAITHLAQPKARRHMVTKKKAWQIQTILDDPRTNPAVECLQLNEVFQFEDTGFWIKVKSNSATLTAARIEFFGWRLIVSGVDSVPNGVKPTRIPVEGYPGTGGE